MQERRPGSRGRVAASEVWVRTHHAVVDAALFCPPALLLALVFASAGQYWQSLSSLVQVGVLSVRRTRPVLAVAVVDLIAALHLLTGVLHRGSAEALLFSPSDVAVLVALYSVAAHGPRWARSTALVVALAGALGLGVALAWAYNDLRQALFVVVAATTTTGVLALLAWTLGQWRRTRLAHVRTLEERARGVETEREQLQALAAAAERARIAREMHDVVAHSLSVVIAQADGGRYAAAADPAAAARALESIAATGRAALTDMRRLLGVLREDGGTVLEPQPGVEDVPALVASVRASGLPVALVTTGEVRQLPAGAGLAVYRVVQEGLTNVLKHGGPSARATVRLHWSPGRLEAHVEDDGRGASTAVDGDGDGIGSGLTGMAERMALYGGTAHAGPRSGGGFAVHAVLPVPASGRTGHTVGGPSRSADGMTAPRT
ncbi:Signal transduction histidine kinase [Quadrisphaera granulorum]|uniref:histidine kinase n=1 Tax=Quadrisphaera granulorum TaxID=317664 RepID=A0A316ASS2_9ACTN|nr:sensor histidine kinase [Quadrisphaera granulorum]PWJ53147.1 signal transduction histidine kinase [Quadrisphaera granulorum]SZE97079.1 Signal transduction histidine kinase [Quadrisphaera granulorum]